MLCRHHPLHASSTPLLASSSCVNASVTAPVCPWLNVSFIYLLFCLCSLWLCCPFVPCPLSRAVSVLVLRPFSRAASVLSCHVCSLMLRLFSRAMSSPPPMLHQPPFPWPILAASMSRPMCADTLTRRYMRGKRHDQNLRVHEAISQPVCQRRCMRARYRTRFRPNKIDRR